MIDSVELSKSIIRKFKGIDGIDDIMAIQCAVIHAKEMLELHHLLMGNSTGSCFKSATIYYETYRVLEHMLIENVIG